MPITVIGAGLAGCEAAWRIANEGVQVRLVEMKPAQFSPAHSNADFAELVCSNSFKSDRFDSAAGLLKNEMRQLGSLCLERADKCRTPAGKALAVDRKLFASAVTQKIKAHPNIICESYEAEKIPVDNGVVVIATGPLTSGSLAKDISKLCGEALSFYDAAAPIVSTESLDFEHAFYGSRYEPDNSDYINCPMNKSEYEIFYNELISAQTVKLKEFEKDIEVYEGCMPIETMAKRGENTIRFGPLKPVGLVDPKTGHRPWAALQLRKENAEGNLCNLVGFQTNLKFSEQKRVFSLIPALRNAEFMRYGVMHRNSFIQSPKVLTPFYNLKSHKNIFFAGQITGVEGYMESASSGILAGINAARTVKGQPLVALPNTLMTGALSNYICDESVKKFQPMGANFGIMPPLEETIKDKKARYSAFSKRALDDLKIIKERYEI